MIGAAAAWVDTVEKFGSGRVTMEEILEPAVTLGEEGFPVSEMMAYYVSFDVALCRACARMLTGTDSGVVQRHSSAAPHPMARRC